MKKITSITICLLMLLCFIQKVNAAEAQKYAGTVITNSTSLNVRSAPNVNSAVISKAQKNSYVTICEKSGNWYKIQYASEKYGWCSADYIKQIYSSAAVVNISSGYLNVRAGAGTNYSVKAKLYNGKSVLVIGTSGSWNRILFNGSETGYVHSAYLTTQKTTGNNIRLNVPNYKQTDARWANTTLGSSGRTIAAIGCTTTCIAMCESYRTGRTITPYDMSKQLSYSSGGSLYWPSNYYTDTSVSFEKVKSILNQKKPVILGLISNAGRTHWVTVTGYEQNTYYINDPGSNSRTTLSQVMSTYQNLYKMAYYK